MSSQPAGQKSRCAAATAATMMPAQPSCSAIATPRAFAVHTTVTGAENMLYMDVKSSSLMCNLQSGGKRDKYGYAF